MSDRLPSEDPAATLTALPIDSDTAQDLVDTLLISCGGRRVLHVGCTSGSVVRALLNLGVDAFGVDLPGAALDALAERLPGRFCDCVGFDALPFSDRSYDSVLVSLTLVAGGEAQLDALFTELRRLACGAVYAVFDLSDSTLTREAIENTAFLVGFRKHPAYYQVNAYEALEHEGRRLSIVLEPMSDQSLARYPLAALRDERDLHMDMLREPGARSDAHVARYHWALSCVRPGDRVLDAACGLGYGSYLLQACSPAATTLGVDGSDYAIDYANCCFAAQSPGLSYQKGFLPDALEPIEDGSIDLIVSFETLEHVEYNERLLEEFHRVLSPGGRLIVSVPNDWSDETGEDPNPFHLHVYTLDTLRDQLSGQFVIEKLVAQSASRHKSGPGRSQWVPAARRLDDVSVAVPQDEAPDAEWWLAIAMRSPVDTDGASYRESIFPEPAGHAWNVTAFARDYGNPWLPRAMVHVHHRLQEPHALAALTDEVLRTAALGSPDQGAALCVEAYQLLRSESLSSDMVSAIASRVATYIAAPPLTAQGVRWHISLLFVLGRLWMAVGGFERARAVLDECVKLDPLAYSPLLGNRTVEAYLLLGVICHVAREPEAAKAYWRHGVGAARQVLAADWREALGDCDVPADFGLPELASVLEHASSCAMALLGSDAADHKCGWWRRPLRNRLTEIARLSRQHGRAAKDKAWHASQREKWEQRARTLEHRVADLENSEQHLGEDKNWLIAQRDAWEARAKDGEVQVDRLQKDMSVLQDARDWLEGQRSQWEAKAGELSAERVRLQSALERCELDYLQACRDRDTQTARANEADSELSRVLADIAWHDDQRKRWEDKAAEVEQALRVAEGSLSECQTSIDWLEGQRAAWENKAAELSDELSRTHAALERCESDYQAACNERDDQAGRVEAADGERVRLQADIAWHDTQRQRWEQSALEIGLRVQALEDDIRERQVATDWLTDQRKAWEDKTKELLAELVRVQASLARCESDYRDACVDRDIHADRADSLSRSVAQKDDDLAVLQHAVVEKETALADLDAWRIRLQGDVAWHDEQSQRWERNAADAVKQVRELEAVVEDRHAAIDWHLKQSAAWEARAQAAEGRVAHLQRDVEKFSENADKMREEISGMQVKSLLQEKKIVALDAELYSLNNLLTRLRSSRVIRLINFLFNKKYF